MNNIGWIIVISTAIYLILLVFNEHGHFEKIKKWVSFRTITTIYLGFVLSYIAFSINTYNKEFLDSYRANDEFEINKMIDNDFINNEIVQFKIEQIKGLIKSINKQNIELSSIEMVKYPELKMKELSSSGLEYLSTHVVDSDDDVDIFINGYTDNYPSVASFLKVQNNNLMDKGKLIRIFIFEEDWIRENYKKAKRMLKKHNELFDDTSRIETPLILLKSAKELLNNDKSLEFCVLNKEECFIWHEDNTGSDKRYKGGVYVFNKEQINDVLFTWNSLYNNSYNSVDDLLTKLSITK